MSPYKIIIFFIGISFFSKANHISFDSDECRIYLDSLLQKEQDGLLDFRITIDPLNACLHFFQSNENWLGFVEAANILTQALYLEKRFTKAEKMAHKSYKICKQKLPNNKSEYSTACHNMAYFTWRKKHFFEAISYYQKVILIEKESNPLELSDAYSGIAEVYKTIGDFEKSKLYFKKAIELTKESKHFNIPAFLSGLAKTYKLQDNYNLAIDCFKQSVEISEQLITEHDESLAYYFKQVIYTGYNDLADIYTKLCYVNKASYYSNLAVQILKDNNEYFEAYKQFEIPAKIDFYSRNYSKAITKYQQAEKSLITQYKGFEKGKDLAQVIAQIGDCYIELEDPENALKEYQRALHTLTFSFVDTDIYTNPNTGHFFNKRSAIELLYKKAKAFNGLYRINHAEKDLHASLKIYELIAELIPITRRDYIEENSKFQLADETQNIFESAIDICFQLFELTGEQMYLKQAFSFTENSKAVLLQEAMQNNEAKKGLHDSLQIRDLKLRSEIAFYENLIGTTANEKANNEDLKRWQAELFDYKETYQDFKTGLERENPNYYAFKYATAIASIDKIQLNLNEQVAIIEYFVGKRFIYIFHIEKENFKLTKLPVSKQLKQDIECLEQYLIYRPDQYTFETDFDSFRYTSNSIFKEIIQPVFRNLSKTINQLTIIPDKHLFNIPFEALLTNLQQQAKDAPYHPENLSYLGEDYSICYSYSSSFLLKTLQHTSSNQSKNFIGYAPDFSDLTKNQDEVKKVNSYFNDVIRIGNLANFSNFSEDVKQGRIIHLATHAKKNNKNHKLNEIYFSDTTLTNYHIENMRIQADLTVLSACETGAGLVQSGEGPMSLARSFFLAGCPSLVSSLWRADDESTADIMLYFYQHLKNGDAKDVALQQAKLQYCSEAGIRKSHPFYWAGFVQSGNRRALF